MSETKIAERLDALLDGVFERKEIRSAVMSVVSGDEAFRWTGARGAVSPDGAPMTPTTPWFIASITKLFIASTVLRMVEEGALALEDRAVDRLPAAVTDRLHVLAGDDQTDRITVEHLLCHASGLADFIEDYPAKRRGEGADCRSLVEILVEDDLIRFFTAVNGGGLFRDPGTWGRMQARWRRFSFPLDRAALRQPSWPIEYGLGVMRFRLPRFLTPFRPVPQVVGTHRVDGDVALSRPGAGSVPRRGRQSGHGRRGPIQVGCQSDPRGVSRPQIAAEGRRDRVRRAVSNRLWFAHPGWRRAMWMRSVATVCLLSAFAGITGGTASAQDGSLAITNVTVIDGTGSAARPHMTVVIRDGRITALDSTTASRLPSDLTVIDGSGKFLIPGLWDMHVHLAKAGEKALGLFVANGVTSVRDMGGDFAVLGRWRSEVEAGVRVGPRIRTAGPMLESAERVRRMKSRGTVEPVDDFRAPVGDASDARRAVDAVARLGADFVKVRTVASVSVYRTIAAEARRVGLTLAAHGDVALPEVMLETGQRSIEHALYPSLQKRTSATRAHILRQLVEGRVAIVPTMVNYYQWLRVAPGDARRIVNDALGLIDPRRRYVSGYLIEDWREQVAERDGIKDRLIRRFYLPRVYRDVIADLQEMYRAGVVILPGTDVAVALMYPGFSLHDELGYFVEAIGMTPLEALRSATRDAAEFSGMLDSLGTVAIGKRADLVLLKADPLINIRDVARIDAVIARGKVFDRAGLARLLADAAR